MSTTSIKQREITIELDARKVVVRRMRWGAARAFLKKLAQHVANLGGSLADVLPKLPELIGTVDELAGDLIINSTDLKKEELDQLDVAQFAALLDAAVELNLGEELKNSFAGIAKNLTALKPATKTNSGAELTPS